jgi:hypothetical protein
MRYCTDGLATVMSVVLFRQGLTELPKSPLVHEGEVSVVERVFHQAQRGSVPHFVELRDAAVFRIVFLSRIENGRERFIECDPGVAVARVAVVGGRREIGHFLLYGKLRDVHQLAGAIVGPAVVAAYELALVAPALGQLGGAMTAAILERRRLPLRIEKQHDVLAEEAKRLWPRFQILHRDDRIPEAAQDILLRRQHIVLRLLIARDKF